MSKATSCVLECTRIETWWWAKYFAPVQTGRVASYILGSGSFPGVKRPEYGVANPLHLTQILKKE